MKYRNALMAVLVSGFVSSIALAADKYEIDPAHTTIGFSIEHLVISKVHGKFKEFSGVIEVDPKASPIVTGASVTIKTASIDTGVDKRDEHLRSADFFDAAKYPEIKFETKAIKKSDTGLTALGTLTIHGVSKEITLPFKMKGPIKDPWGKSRLGISANTTINRKDYGLTWSKALETGGLVVGDEVELDIQAEAVKAEPEKK
jgi:polyisoprenoid-binding protein YceI